MESHRVRVSTSPGPGLGMASSMVSKSDAEGSPRGRRFRTMERRSALAPVMCSPSAAAPDGACGRVAADGGVWPVSAGRALGVVWTRYCAVRLPRGTGASAREATLPEKGELFIRTRPPEHVVAMREAAEAGDNAAMMFRIGFRVVVEPGAQREAQILVGEIFRVHEGKAEEL